MAQKISGLTALSTTYADTDLLEVSVDTGGGTFVSRKMTFLQLRTAFTKLQANLDVNSFQITSASNGNIIIRPNGSGAVLVGGNSTQATELRFMEDSDNGTNYVALKVANALAASTTYTLPTADGTSGQVLSTNGSGTLSWSTAGGGLTKFTEAESTSAPNGTVYVDSLTVAASSTNADAAIVPKGTGALLAAVPDNTATGGNKRGINALDLQTLRSSATEVASGQYSVLAGVYSTASGSQSVVLGYGSIGNNQAAVAISQSASATGQGAVSVGLSSTSSAASTTTVGRGSTSSDTSSAAFGYNNTASGFQSLAIGSENITSGAYSSTVGWGNTANSSFASAYGAYAHTFGIYGRQAFASYFIGAVADCQKSIFFLKQRTTGNTATTLTANNSTAGSGNQVILSNNSGYRFKGTIIGKKSGTTDVAAWDIDGIIVRGANAASTTLAVSTVTLVQNTPAWGTPTLAADTTNGGLQVQVTGAAATNIQWTAVIETTEVIYA